MGVFTGQMVYREQLQKKFGEPLLSELDNIYASFSTALKDVVQTSESNLSTTIINNITNSVLNEIGTGSKYFDLAIAELTVENTSTETAVYTKTITKGTLSSGKGLKVNLQGLWERFLTGSTNATGTNLAVKVTFGGTVVVSGNIATGLGRADDVKRPHTLEVWLSNVADNTQRWIVRSDFAGGGGATAAWTTSPYTNSSVAWMSTTDKDTAADQVFEILITHSQIDATLKYVRQWVTVESIDSSDTSTPTVPASSGGTGLSSYAVGDILYASATTALSTLAIGTAGQVLNVSGGLPAWTSTLANAVQDNITRLGTLTAGPGGFSANHVVFHDGTTVVGNDNIRWDGTLLILQNSGGELRLDSRAIPAFNRYLDTATLGPQFTAQRARGTRDTPTVVVDGDLLGAYQFSGYSGAAAAFRQAVRIAINVDGEPDTAGDTTDMPGRLSIITTPDGSSSGTEAFRINNQQNVFIGAAEPYPTAGSKVLIFGDGTAPSGMGLNTAGLYANDVAGTVEMFAVDEGTTSTQISPHNFTLFTPEDSHAFPWSYYSKNEYLGIEVNVDIAKLVRLVQQQTGQQLFYKRDLPGPKRDWVNDQEFHMRKRMAEYDRWNNLSEEEKGPAPPLPALKHPPEWLKKRIILNTVKASQLKIELDTWKLERGLL